MEQLIVIKYGELTTKKGNRNTFINALKNNIKRVLVNNDYNIIANRDHIYIETKEIDDVLKKLKKVCGIQGILVAYKVNTNTDTIKEEVLNILKI